MTDPASAIGRRASGVAGIFGDHQNNLHHVGIICRTEKAAEQLMELTGMRARHRGHVPAYEAVCIFCGAGDGSAIELVIPSGGTLRRFNRGAGGLHHIAITVPSLEDLARVLGEAKMDLLEPEPVRGAGDFHCNFLSPVFTGGVTIEFVELDRPEPV